MSAKPTHLPKLGHVTGQEIPIPMYLIADGMAGRTTRMNSALCPEFRKESKIQKSHQEGGPACSRELRHERVEALTPVIPAASLNSATCLFFASSVFRNKHVRTPTEVQNPDISPNECRLLHLARRDEGVRSQSGYRPCFWGSKGRDTPRILFCFRGPRDGEAG